MNAWCAERSSSAGTLSAQLSAYCRPTFAELSKAQNADVLPDRKRSTEHASIEILEEFPMERFTEHPDPGHLHFAEAAAAGLSGSEEPGQYARAGQHVRHQQPIVAKFVDHRRQQLVLLHAPTQTPRLQWSHCKFRTHAEANLRSDDLRLAAIYWKRPLTPNCQCRSTCVVLWHSQTGSRGRILAQQALQRNKFCAACLAGNAEPVCYADIPRPLTRSPRRPMGRRSLPMRPGVRAERRMGRRDPEGS